MIDAPNYYEILNKAIKQKEVYIGPFYGEFGHLLIHVLPFLGYLHQKGIKIRYCGHEGQQDLLVDTDKKPIYTEYFALPPHFDKSVPEMNDYRYVKDESVLKLADEWKETAKKSGLPFFDLSDPHNYRFVWWEWWFNNRYGKLYNIGRAYNPEQITEHAVAVYSRTKPLGTAQGAGEPFDIVKIVDIAAKYVDKVYVVGHPDQAHTINHPKVENIITMDNASIIKAVSKCKAILSHNSGAAYMAKMLRIPGIVFHNGELARFMWTIHCSDRWSKSPLTRAVNYDEIESTLKRICQK